MRQTVPLLITALGGFVLIAAFFSPYTESWGERAAIWFDILAAIAFILGGGNLLKTHLRKVAAQTAGWGYSGVTLVAFLLTLYVGLVKWGSPPAPRQEFFGQLFAPLPATAFPLTYSVEGTIPKSAGATLPASVQLLLSVDRDKGTISFRSWMAEAQRRDLEEIADRRDWHDTVAQLFKRAQPPAPLRGRVFHHAAHGVLAFQAHMTEDQRDTLLRLGSNAPWTQAVKALYTASQRVTRVPVRPEVVPPGFRSAAPDHRHVALDDNRLSIQGPMTVAQRDQLAQTLLPVARPLSAPARDELLGDLRSLGPLLARQVRAFDAVLQSTGVQELSAAQRRKAMCVAMLRVAPLTEPQRDFLLDGYRREHRWRTVVGQLFVQSQQVKYPWSGGYRAAGTPFWWLYEYAFKPLTATMFAMLAFYVASAAFRAFRAKNLEAVLLLGTAFIILLGQTFAGVKATEWLPNSLSGLRIENLSVTIMSILNTAGNRAIMIGIALGIASTSLRVLLGIDRSYLSSGGD